MKYWLVLIIMALVLHVAYSMDVDPRKITVTLVGNDGPANPHASVPNANAIGFLATQAAELVRRQQEEAIAARQLRMMEMEVAAEDRERRAEAARQDGEGSSSGDDPEIARLGDHLSRLFSRTHSEPGLRSEEERRSAELERRRSESLHGRQLAAIDQHDSSEADALPEIGVVEPQAAIRPVSQWQYPLADEDLALPGQQLAHVGVMRNNRFRERARNHAHPYYRECRSVPVPQRGPHAVREAEAPVPSPQPRVHFFQSSDISNQ